MGVSTTDVGSRLRTTLSSCPRLKRWMQGMDRWNGVSGEQQWSLVLLASGERTMNLVTDQQVMASGPERYTSSTQSPSPSCRTSLLEGATRPTSIDFFSHFEIVHISQVSVFKSNRVQPESMLGPVLFGPVFLHVSRTPC